MKNRLNVVGTVWLLWSVLLAVGSWLHVESIKPDRTTALLWFILSGLLMLAYFIADCTDTILRKLQ